MTCRRFPQPVPPAPLCPDSLAGHVRRLGQNARFDLLLLENGEYYLEDFSVFHCALPARSGMSFERCAQRRARVASRCARGA